jgi:hypothetical protein
MTKPNRRKRVTRGNIVAEPRQVIKIGQSHYISLPPEFLKAHGIKAGDWLPTAANHILKIIPMTEERTPQTITKEK